VDSSASPPNNLPVPLTSFIGRERELTQVKGFLSATRLLTLTGAGGAGKTRLALQVAAEALEDFADGVWLIDLALRADPALVPQTVAAVLSVSEQLGRPLTDTLADYLRHKSLLLVLDNCEHLQTASATLATVLLRGCRHLRILATSRIPLGVPGETLWRVPSLSLPDPNRLPSLDQIQQYEAVRLFVERARGGQLTFALSSDNAPVVVQICQRLDGIPLAIELAAARTRVLAVEQIAARLDDRFRLLTGGSSSALPRQRTLQATMDWSYSLLAENERTLFRQLSVFVGGWTLDAAEAVCSGGVEQAEILDVLTQLVDKSLVTMEPKSQEARYRLLETVRQYGLDRLRESEEVDGARRRHRNWYLALAEHAAPELGGPQQGMWFDRLETEHDNLRAALAWSLAAKDGAEAGLRLTGALRWFWARRGHWREGRKWLDAALERSAEVPPSVSSRALLGATHFAWRGGDYELATTLGQKGLALSRQRADKEGSAAFLSALAIVALYLGDYVRATRLCEETLILSRELGNKSLTGTQLTHLGVAARMKGDYARAIALHSEGRALFRELGDKWNIAMALWTIGQVHIQQDDFGRATASFVEGLILCKDVGDRWISQGCLEGLARVASAQGDYKRAARLLGGVEELHKRLGYRRPLEIQASHDRHVASARAALGDTAFAAAWGEGQSMTLQEIINYALDSANVPSSKVGKGKSEEGTIHLLTTREQEVATLVARGLTNRQIATRLVITERTAETHVQNILNKLGFNSRAQVAAWAANQGLHTISQD
jgi:non-specific serine/threonine protein kinase